MDLSIGITCITGDTPKLPDAKRGDYSPTLVTETGEQLNSGLIWWECLFCNGYVLIDSHRNTREKCQCGAIRVNSQGNANWQRGDDIAYFI